MPVNFEILRQDGSVILSTETKPIAPDYRFYDIVTSTSGTGWTWNICDPETKATNVMNTFRYEGPVLENNIFPAFRFVEGQVVALSMRNFSQIYKQGGHNASKPTLCRVALVDVGAYNPPEVSNDFIRAYDSNGVLSWSLNSIIKSVQLIDFRSFTISDSDTYANSSYYMDVPNHLDINKVFVTPTANGLPYWGDTSSGGSFSELFITTKLVGRRYYFTLTLHQYFNGDMLNSCDNLNYKIKEVTGFYSFGVAMYFMPSAT